MLSRLMTLALALAQLPAPAAVTYSLRDAHFFGGVPGPTREILQGGAFNSSTTATLPFVFSSGGATPTVFTALSGNQGSPFELRASNQIDAGESVALTFNTSPNNPTTLVSLVQSGITESGITITGAAGIGYFLPTFRVFGSFNDSHSSAFAQLGICAGIPFCPLTGLGNSAGGAQTVDTLYTPDIGASSAFTFGTPFSYFFFLSSGVSSLTNGTLAPGNAGGDFRLQLAGYRVVDENGVDILGAQVNSDLFNSIPEPGAIWFTGAALVAVFARRSGRRFAFSRR